MIIDYVEMLRKFHEKYGHLINDKPKVVPGDIRDLRVRLITEEVYDELLVAIDDGELTEHGKVSELDNLTELADALADSLYVIFGTAVSYGIPIDEVFEEVHKSNMTKSMEKSKHGKTKKGDDFQPARIREIIERHMKGD